MRKLSIIACAFLVVRNLAPAQTDAGPAAAPTQTPYTPLTQSDRLHSYIKGAFSVEALVRSAAGAAVLQGTDTPHEWGQGAEGYARRFGNSYAQQVMRQTLMYGVADALHEDNRYVPSGRTVAGARLKYAVASTFLARKDDGTRRFSYSRFGSTLTVAFLSREWQPPSEDKPRNAALSFGTVLSSEIGFNIAREFWPKIFKPH